MPLFVPVLRLLMLFLNVYDSYKTLKRPPPSSRNEGRPSVRATTQRKRDMKGCLAVWIVWCSLIMYERLVEGITCLFIPFYDELKSLGLLFLILTRARGAEPIYLHLIRPLIKPYTRTLDGILDIILMFGDFILALSMYPLQVGLHWWKKRFGGYYEQTETEQSIQTDSSNEVNSSEVPTSFLVSSGDQAEGVRARRAPARDPPPRRSSTDKARNDHPSTRRPPAESSRPKSNQAREAAGRKETSKRRPSPPSRKQSKVMPPLETPPDRPSAGMEPNLFKPLLDHRREGAEAPPHHHQIWYPPRSSHTNEDEQVDIAIQASKLPDIPKDQSRQATLAQQQLDEWRQYPPFPSAYPPTPLATDSRLVHTPLMVPSSIYPAIQEEQDFSQSLLPPREPLNPSPAGDLSDNYSLPGISPQSIATDSSSVDEADDSMSADDDDDDEEDDFNLTLRTPLPQFGTLRSQIRPLRLAAVASASSAASIPSRSSVLTTADDRSLRTTTSSDSLVSPVKSQADSSSVLGRKRSYPRTRALNVRNRVREIEERDDDSQEVSDDPPPKVTPTKYRKMSKSHPQLRQKQDTSDTADDVTKSSTGSNLGDLDKEQIPPEEKRRRVIRSPRPVRSLNSVRPRARRNATFIPQTQGIMVESLNLEGPKRRSSRLRSGTSSASVSDPPPPVPPKI